MTPELRHELSMGKYTRWAANLTENRLQGLLWLLGELLVRLKPEDIDHLRQLHPRAVAALRWLLAGYRSGAMPTIGEVKAAPPEAA